MKYVTVSGIDRSGKTTLIKEYLEKTNYRDYLVDRDPSNIFALNFAQKRWNNENHDWSAYRKFMRHHRAYIDLAILLVCDVDVLEERFAATNEPEIAGHYTIEEHQKIIEDFFYSAEYPNVLVMNTSYIDIESEVKLVINRVEELRNANK